MELSVQRDRNEGLVRVFDVEAGTERTDVARRASCVDRVTDLGARLRELVGILIVDFGANDQVVTQNGEALVRDVRDV